MAARTWLSRLVAIGATATIVASTEVASAQRTPTARAEVRGQAAGAPKGKPSTGLAGHLGIAVAARLLSSDDASARLRGVERLGALGTPEATSAITEALEQSSPIARDTRARLVAVRALAPFAARDNVRLALVRELSDPAAESRAGGSPLGALVRDSAALALARSGDRKALLALTNAVLQGGAGAEAATRALEAAPPEAFAPLVEGRKALPPALVALLGRLGDARAIPRLRATLAEPDPATKALAAVALAKLGDDSAAAIARGWLGKGDAALAKAAAETLAWLGTSDAPQAIAALVGADATRADGVELALSRPSPALAKPLAAALASAAPEVAPRVVAAIGRAGGPDAARVLEALLARPEHAWAAAHALATSPGGEARAAIERRLVGDAASRRLGVRAAVTRALALGDEPRGLGAALDALERGSPADVAVARFARVALGARSPRAALEACGGARCPAHVVAAIARGALSRGGSGLDALAPALAAAGDEPGLAAIAAGVALLARPDGGEVPTPRLAAWAEAGGPLAPLAARALPTRDDETTRARVRRLLEATDAVVRAHVALGLGRDPAPDAVSLLAGGYRFEDDAAVRRAIVRALSLRTEPQRAATLALARDLDPDEGVRALARAALAGRRLEPSAAAGGAVAWLLVAPSDGRAPSATAARLTRADGLSVPLVADPDGAIVVPGVPFGPAALVLAPATAPGDAPPR
jgi:hypothetical protein